MVHWSIAQLLCSMLLWSMYTHTKELQVYTVVNGDDAKKLVSKVTEGLKIAAQRQLARLEQGSGTAFKPSKSLKQQQASARTRLAEQVLPVITRKVETKVGGNKPARMSIIDGEKINQLSAQQMLKVLENLASGLRMLPPLPDQVTEWARTITPLLSFDKKTQHTMAETIGRWFDVLLQNEADLEKLARISGTEQTQQHEQISALRENYKEYYHNASQLLYPWIQIALLLNARDPLGTWLSYATDDPQALRTKFKKVVEAAQNALEKAGRDVLSEADARGFILLAIASLFAPEEVFQGLNKKGARSANEINKIGE